MTTVEFLQPRTLAEATAAMRDHGEAAVLAGGTDLVVHSRSRGVPLPRTLVSLGRAEELRQIAVDDDGNLHLGAMVTHSMIEDSAAVQARWTSLSDAAAIIGSPATRNLGTIGGNLCNGSPAMELGGPLLSFGASVVLSSSAGDRSLAIDEFLLGPGRTARRADELLREVVIPPPAPATGSAYLRLGFREAMEIAILGVAAVLTLGDGGDITACRLTLTAVAPTIVRARKAEQVLVGRPPSPEALREAGDLAKADAAPIDDLRAPAEYRLSTLGVITQRALGLALRRARS
jgi:CO/xanthine dehydrogenase FAD-binding subunit